MTTPYDDHQAAFLDTHRMGVLATTRRDGSPQQSLVAYAVDGEGRLVVSTKSYTAKWHNALRQPSVSLTVVDGRVHLVIQGTAEAIADDPGRAELTAEVFAALSGGPPPDPTTLVDTLDEQQRVILRITPTSVLLHE